MVYAEMGLKWEKNVSTVTKSDQLLKMLDLGRFDVIVTARFNGLYYINKLNLHSIYQLHPIIERRMLYHYFHKKHKKLIPKIDRVIRSMKKSGELTRLRKRFIIQLMRE